jgi:hypothetical protein
MCGATVRVDLEQPAVLCTACSARFVPALAIDPVLTASAIQALETTAATARRARNAEMRSLLLVCLGGPLGGIVLGRLGVSSFWACVMLLLEAYVGCAVWSARVSRRPALPGATALRRDGGRASPPPA